MFLDQHPCWSWNHIPELGFYGWALG